MTDFETMWKKSVNDMIDSIKSNDMIHDYLLSFEPCENTGYAWTKDKKYKEYSNYLDQKTGYVHSGASFACCIRESVDIIRNELVVVKGISVDVDDDFVVINIS